MKTLLVLLSVLARPVWSSVETVLAVTQCRASCLDQFIHVIRTEDNCRKDSNCFMCWESCQMLFENFNIWGPLCSVPDVCLPGCRKACSFIETRKNRSTFSSSGILLRSVYDPHLDRVSLEWDLEEDLKSESTVLYSILLKDENPKWYEIAQTTSHVVHLKRGLLNRNTSIRVIAANATSQVSDSETSYVDSFINGASYHKSGSRDSHVWKPRLESMVQSEISIGLLATITWPVRRIKAQPTHYEVSWNVIDDSIEITGHLYTSSNATVLTLWPNSLYSVQVKSYTSEKDVHSESELLIIDTRNEVKETTTSVLCSTVPGDNIAVNVFAALSAFFLTCLTIAFVCILKSRKQNLSEGSASTKQLHGNSALYRFPVFSGTNRTESKKNQPSVPVAIKFTQFEI